MFYFLELELRSSSKINISIELNVIQLELTKIQITRVSKYLIGVMFLRVMSEY